MLENALLRCETRGAQLFVCELTHEAYECIKKGKKAGEGEKKTSKFTAFKRGRIIFRCASLTVRRRREIDHPLETDTANFSLAS